MKKLDENHIPNHRIALYPGSFDVLTYGHLDLIERASPLFDRLIIGVACNSAKKSFFDLEQRLEIIRACTEKYPNVTPVVVEGLTIKMAEKLGAQFILRGLRAVSDFEFELQLALTNRQLSPNVETIFLTPSPEFIFLSSSMVKEIWRLGGDISGFVPPEALNAMEKYGKKNDEG
jgi:pantetheine-phosphate adenylyltransferase